MNRKIWLIVLLLGSLILLLGGMRRPERPADAAADPAVRNAETVVSQNVSGSGGEWQKAARENPQWILQIEAVEE